MRRNANRCPECEHAWRDHDTRSRKRFPAGGCLRMERLMDQLRWCPCERGRPKDETASTAPRS